MKTEQQPDFNYVNDQEKVDKFAEEHSAAKLKFIDMSGWDDVPVPKREWAVGECIPIGQPALFSGEGSAGKSLCVLQLGAASVLGQDWFGLPVIQGPVIYVSAEDGEDELHRRMFDIAGYHQV